jgi:hypothetical protein
MLPLRRGELHSSGFNQRADRADHRKNAGNIALIEGMQLSPRMVRMPHSDAHSHPLRGQAVHQSPTEEAPSTEHHNHGHHLLRQAGGSAHCPSCSCAA